MNGGMREKRIVIISVFDFLSYLALRKIFEKYEEGSYEIVGIIEVVPSLSQFTSFLGKYLSNVFLFYLVYEYFLSFVYSFFYKGRSKVESFVKNNKVKRFKVDDVNSSDTIKIIKKLDANLIVSVRPTQIFRKVIISSGIPIINIHNSEIQKYRGVANIFWSLRYGEEKIGISIFKVVDSRKIDFGPIVRQEFVEVPERGSLFSITVNIYNKSSDVLYDAVENFREQGLKNPDKCGRYFTLPGIKDIFEFKRKGYSLFSLNDLFLFFRLENLE